MRLIRPSDRFCGRCPWYGWKCHRAGTPSKRLWRSSQGRRATHPKPARAQPARRRGCARLDDRAKARCGGACCRYGGGIEANRSRPADFLLDNLRIETQVIEAAWRAGARGCYFWAAAAFTQNLQTNLFERITTHRCTRAHQCLVCHCKNRRYQALRGVTHPARFRCH